MLKQQLADAESSAHAKEEKIRQVERERERFSRQV